MIYNIISDNAYLVRLEMGDWVWSPFGDQALIEYREETLPNTLMSKCGVFCRRVGYRYVDDKGHTKALIVPDYQYAAGCEVLSRVGKKAVDRATQ